ncbi:MAG: DUF5050 domain-containing protein, partial [Lachnospiraceae bacterium]|nr:DUF5050 domain-containing protein [Lachnospiraceae bacterium]
MNKRVLGLIIAVLVIAGVIGGTVLVQYLSRIPDNPPDTIGNTSGNLNNKGLVCENDGYIYFANLADNHCLYRMTTDGNDAEKLADIPVAYINAAGDYLYFYFDDPGGPKFMGA